MKILLHSCCAPCTIYPLEQLSDKVDIVEVIFYNPNIHPFQEYKARKNSLESYLSKKSVPLHIPEEYDLNSYFQKVVFNEKERCSICYDLRFEYTFSYASQNGFDAVTSTLLYSKYQNHSVMKSLCEKYSQQFNVTFYYEDFRKGWQSGIDKSIELDMYRQKYCGCIYSEQERYDNRLKKRLRKQYKLNKKQS